MCWHLPVLVSIANWYKVECKCSVLCLGRVLCMWRRMANPTFWDGVVTPQALAGLWVLVRIQHIPEQPFATTVTQCVVATLLNDRLYQGHGMASTTAAILLCPCGCAVAACSALHPWQLSWYEQSLSQPHCKTTPSSDLT